MKNFTVVAISGSTRFKDECLEAQRTLTLNGNIVLMCPIFHHADGLNLAPEKYEELKEMHRQRIDMASKLYVVNPGGYIGGATAQEIQYAHSQGKEVTYLY
jgi:hypothetical protein